MNDQKLIAESKNFEQHMLDRDKRQPKPVLLWEEQDY